MAVDKEQLLRYFLACKQEAEDATRERRRQNAENHAAYMDQQDWSGKIDGQSKEFLPKTFVAVEQFAATMKQALLASSTWYTPLLALDSPFPLTADNARALLDAFLAKVAVSSTETRPIESILSDGLKAGALSSLAVFKIMGQRMPGRRYRLPTEQGAVEEPPPATEAEPVAVEPTTGDLDAALKAPPESGQVATLLPPSEDYQPWYLRVDLVRQEDYLQDPTGRGLYVIHRSYRDLYEVQQNASAGVYDKAAVDALANELTSSVIPKDETARALASGQNVSRPPSFRRQVEIYEFWGTVLDDKGRVTGSNVFFAVANDRHLIRSPKPNPFWHQRPPFVAIPIISVPGSTVHRALMDAPVRLNTAMNELANLIIDGGLASVWGVRQVRMDDLEEPEQVQGGIPFGAAIKVKPTLPHGQKAIEVVAEGEVTPSAMSVFEYLSREFAQAALSNELKMGQFPGHSVKATEVVELSQANSIMAQGIAKDIEMGLGDLLGMCWITLMQHLDQVDSQMVVSAVGMPVALALSNTDEAGRYGLFASGCGFRVQGLTAMLTRGKDFQKVMAALQVLMANPMLAGTFFQLYSPDKIVAYVMSLLGIDSHQIARATGEQMKMMQELAAAQQMAQLNGPQGSPPSPELNQGGALPAEVNQQINPMTGMTPVGQGG